MNIEIFRAMGGFGGGELIPFKSDALLYINGTILNDGGTYYFVNYGSTGSAWNLLITGYDFDSTWLKGFPYKSAATVSAPAADAAFIAADLNNFFYDSEGAPNQIPVVSFFQNVDYEHRLYSKHIAQAVDSNGVETYEPRIKEIVLYATARTGSKITTCDNYFDVPTKLTSNIREVGAGKTYSTITAALAAASAGETIYVYTGTVYESTGSLVISKSLTIKGVGNVVITTNNAAYGVFVNTNNVTVSNLVFFETKTTSNLHNNNKTGVTFNNIYASVSSPAVFYNLGDTINNCVVKLNTTGAIAFNKYTSAAKLTLNTCYVSGVGLPIANITAGTNNIDINNSNLIGVRCALAASNAININGCTIKGTTYPINITGTGTYIIKNSTLEKNGAAVNNFVDIITTGTSSLTIDNCTLKSSRSCDFLIKNLTSVTFKNNLYESQGTGKNISVKITSVTEATVVDVYNNRGTAQDGDSPILCIGNESAEGYDIMSGNVYNNLLIGPRYYNPASTTTQHALPVFNQLLINTYRNKIIGSSLGIVYKDAGTDLSGCASHHNVIEDCHGGMLVKGGCNLKMYGNTIKSVLSFTYLLSIIENVAAVATGNVFKNNILSDTGSGGTGVCYYIDNDCIASSEIDNNSVFGDVLSNQTTSWATWQGLGFDTNSLNQNPNLTTGLWPTLPIKIGASLPGYTTGLDITTNWGNETQVPVIVTKENTDNQIGAYIQ